MSDALTNPRDFQEATMTERFEMTDKTYCTDSETLRVLRTVVESYRKGGSRDASAVSAMMHAGIATGRIVELPEIVTACSKCGRVECWKGVNVCEESAADPKSHLAYLDIDPTDLVAAVSDIRRCGRHTIRLPRVVPADVLGGYDRRAVALQDALGALGIDARIYETPNGSILHTTEYATMPN